MKAFVAICLCLFAFVSAQDFYSVVFKNNKLEVVPGKLHDSLAFGYFDNTISKNGWSILSISNPNEGDHLRDEKIYAAGFLEGYLTHSLIWPYFQNTFPTYGDQEEQWLKQNWEYMQKMMRENPQDEYWRQVQLTLRQLEGLTQGYNEFSNNPIDPFKFMVLQTVGTDLSTLKIKYGHPDRFYGEHCSGLIRVTNDFSDIFAGHTTWAGFNTMMRIYKNYNLDFGTQSRSVVYSGYPGTLPSTDDFYITDQQLSIIETTNSYYNQDLSSLLSTDSVLYWIRIQVSTRMSRTGEDWCKVFSKYNSGTYNNQWFVVDYKLFTPYNVLPPGLFYVLEQIPGKVIFEDMTQVLAMGSWTSYNIPFYPSIYNVSGFQKMKEQYGDLFSYQLAPRAKIFRRDVPKIHTLADFQREMRYNDYQNDPFSEGSPANAISSRFDLAPKNTTNQFLAHSCFGGLDSKVTSYALAKKMRAWAQSGPTHDQQPVFEWKNCDSSVSHAGMPNAYNFTWVLMGF